ncbi:MAG: hypothetical protein KF892_20440 [Rhizobacter sp.]|nr:hypothetical protein [Rhizobacter sp.]
MRLDIDIDSEVYPELHAALSALKSTRARAERLRQLAATGLVGEKVRLHGSAAMAAPAGDTRADIVTRADVKPLAPPEPAPRPTERRRKRPSRADMEQVMRELPVLMDVVADVMPLPSPHDDEPHHLDPHDEPAPWAAMNAYPDDLSSSDDDDAHDDSAPLPDATLHVTALSHKPATRSRLMRMKERGLFKNG